MSPEQRVSDDLIEAAIRGGTSEADDLIRAVWPHAYRIAFSIVRNRSLAEDAAQEASAVLFRSINRLRSTEAFGVWFYRIVVRQAVTLEKRNAPTVIEANPNSQNDLDGSMLRVDVCKALALLTSTQRAAVALHYYGDMSSREIADVLGLKDSSIRFHIMKAKRILEQALRSDVEEFSFPGASYGAA